VLPGALAADPAGEALVTAGLLAAAPEAGAAALPEACPAGEPEGPDAALPHAASSIAEPTRALRASCDGFVTPTLLSL